MSRKTLSQIESALDGRTHAVWAAMRNGRFWVLRRNGKTQTWKTRPGEFRIPVKAGLKAYGEITDASPIGDFATDVDWRDYNFVIAPCETDLNKKA